MLFFMFKTPNYGINPQVTEVVLSGLKITKFIVTIRQILQIIRGDDIIER